MWNIIRAKRKPKHCHWGKSSEMKCSRPKHAGTYIIGHDKDLGCYPKSSDSIKNSAEEWLISLLTAVRRTEQRV